jgi:hypothetical protein
MALLFNADLRLRNGLHLVSSVSLPPFLFRGHNSGFLTAFLCRQVVGLSPKPQQSTVFTCITPGEGWPSYTHRYQVPILIAFYDLYGLQWDYSFPRSPHGDSGVYAHTKILHIISFINDKIFEKKLIIKCVF